MTRPRPSWLANSRLKLFHRNAAQFSAAQAKNWEAPIKSPSRNAFERLPVIAGTDEANNEKEQHMKNAQHTPGPWKQCLHLIAKDTGSYRNGGVICIMTAREKNKVTDEDKANARLIAAAPDLLEALEAVMETKIDPEDKSFWLEKARAAIAKATLENRQ